MVCRCHARKLMPSKISSNLPTNPLKSNNLKFQFHWKTSFNIFWSLHKQFLFHANMHIDYLPNNSPLSTLHSLLNKRKKEKGKSKHIKLLANSWHDVNEKKNKKRKTWNTQKYVIFTSKTQSQWMFDQVSWFLTLCLFKVSVKSSCNYR